jgi:hypothetical protein
VAADIVEALRDVIADADTSAPAIDELIAFRGVRGQGIFHVHDVEIGGRDGLWVAKWPNHERELERRRLFIELIVARLGHLFTRRLTPEYSLAKTPDELRGRVTCPVEEAKVCGKPLGEGTAFATHLEEGSATWKRLPNMDSSVGAAILAFQTWTNAGDPQILGNRLDNSAVSIDHDDYLQGNWEWDGRSDPDIEMTAAANLEANDVFRDIHLYREFLEALGDLPPVRIARACGGMPADWFAPLDDRTRIARYLLARRPLVEGAIRRWVQA